MAPQKQMADEALEKLEGKIDEPAHQALKRASITFHQENPYVAMTDRGALYLPPESKARMAEGKDEDDSGDDEAGEGDDHEMPSMPKEIATDLKRMMSTTLEEADQSHGDWTPTEVWHVNIFPDGFVSSKHTTPDGKLKPRRPMPQLKASELLQGLTQVAGNWVYQKPINEWPALRGFVLASITFVTTSLGMKSVNRLWNAAEGKPLPKASEINKSMRATFLAPKWFTIGWEPDSPGYVCWFSEQHGEPRLLCGSKMLDTMDNDEPLLRNGQVTKVHQYVHRYPVAHETTRDKMTYHALLVVEWSHGKFLTLLELAFLNGLGGYGGKANWVEDKLSPTPVLYSLMGPGMIQPWSTAKSEIRIFDLPMKTKTEFEAYLDKYSAKGGLPLPQQRFAAWELYSTGTPKLGTCKASDLAAACLNYIQRNPQYETVRFNCQNFGADFFSYITGTRGNTPYTLVVRSVYQQRTFSILYAPA